MPSALYAPGKKGIQYATRLVSSQNPEHLKAYLLCFECEQRFNNFGEWEVLRWLAPRAHRRFPLYERLRDGSPLQEFPRFSLFRGSDVGLNAEKFAYFTLSVVWRRSIHQWTGFDGTPLPMWNLGTFGEEMRAFLAGESQFPGDTAVMVMVCSDEYTRQFWTTPTADVVDNCLGVEFIARGVYFRVLMGRHLAPEFRYVSCGPPTGHILLGQCRELTRDKLSVFAFPTDPNDAPSS